MPEDINTSVGNALAADPTQSPTQAVTNTSPDTPAVDGNNEQLSLEEARKLRKENQALRARQKTIDDAEAQRQQEALSNEQKAIKRAEDAETKYQQEHKAHVNVLVQNAAYKKGIIDPDLAALAIESQLEFGDDGKPSNLDKLLDDLIKNKPYLAKAAEPTTTPAQQQRPIPQFTPNNPGRSGIQTPGQTPQGKRPSLYDSNLWKK